MEPIDLSKFKSVSIVLEGFLILQVAHFLGGEYVARALLWFNPDIPELTAALIASSNTSPIVAIIYMALRFRGFPGFIMGPNLVLGTVGGVVLSWIITFLGLIVYEGTVLQVEEILKLPSFYKYHGVISLYFGLH